MVFYQICSSGDPRVQNGPAPESPSLDSQKQVENIQNLLQYHLHQMLEIRYVALPSGTLSSLFKSRYEYARTHGFEA